MVYDLYLAYCILTAASPQTIDYIKATSPELPFYRELKKANRQEDLFKKVGSMLRNQKINEENAENSINSGEVLIFMRE